MVTTTLVIVYALSIACQVHGGQMDSPAGPYDIVVQKVENCLDEGTGQIHFTTRIDNMGNRRYTYNSPFSIGVPMDDDFSAHADMLEHGNGGYKRFVEYTARSCKEMWSFLGDLMQGMLEAAGVTVTECPIPKGNYTAKNFEMIIKINNVPVMIYNNYKLVSTFYYRDVKVGCLITYMDLVPKPIKVPNYTKLF